MSLEYFLSEKEGLVVIAFKGSFGQDSGPELLRCLQACLAKLPRGIVIHMAELGPVPREKMRDFGSFLRDLRVNGTPFRLSGLEQRARTELVQAGLADRSEVKGTLEEAAKEVWQRVRAAA